MEFRYDDNFVLFLLFHFGCFLPLVGREGGPGSCVRLSQEIQRKEIALGDELKYDHEMLSMLLRMLEWDLLRRITLYEIKACLWEEGPHERLGR